MLKFSLINSFIHFHLAPSHNHCPPSVQIIGDNLDTNEKPSRQTSMYHGKSHHWFSLYAVKDRVSGNHLPDELPLADVSELSLSTWLPSISDCIIISKGWVHHPCEPSTCKKFHSAWLLEKWSSWSYSACILCRNEEKIWNCKHWQLDF